MGMEPPTWQVRLFGVLALRHGGVDVDLPPSAAARALLAFLVLRRARPQSRVALIHRFWPDLPEARGRRAITQALWHVRSTLPDLVLADDSTVGLAGPDRLWDDVSRFDALTDGLLASPDAPPSSDGEGHEPALREAHALYTGDLLEGLHADWISPERERRRERYLLVLRRLATIDRAAGRLEAAREGLQRLVRLDPLREGAQRELMRIYAAMGRPAEALRQFQACRGHLEAELGEDPAAETVALAAEIARRGGLESPAFVPLPGHRSEDGPAFGSLPLLGRGEERARLVGHVEAMIDGHGGIVLVEGAPGVGKSRLLEEVARDAAWRGADVLAARATGEDSEAYGLMVDAIESGLTPLRVAQLAALVEPVWLQVLAPYLPTVAGEMPDLGVAPTVREQAAGNRLREAFAELLGAWGRVAPLLLQLDDLHAADPDTLAALVALPSSIQGARLLIVAGLRGDEARADSQIWANVQALDRGGLRDRLRLDRLDPDATGGLLRAALGPRIAPDLVAACVTTSAGHPLYVRQLLLGWHEQGRLQMDEDGVWRLEGSEPVEATVAYAEDPQPVPEALETVIEERLDRLMPGARQTIEAAAVLGGQLAHPELQRLAGLDAEALLGALRRLVSHGMLVEGPSGYHFDHDLLREVTLLAMPRARYLALHRAAADILLTAEPPDDARLAIHFGQAEVWDRAIDHGLAWAEAAHAAAANESAWRATRQVLQQLEQHAPWPVAQALPRRARSLRLRRRLAWMRGEPGIANQDAATMAELLERTDDPDLKADLLRSLIHQAMIVRKDFEQAAHWVAASRDLVAGSGPSLDLVQVERDEAMLLRFADRHDEARIVLEGAIAQLDGLSELDLRLRQEMRGRLLGEASIVCRRGGELEAALELARQSVASAERAGHSELLVYSLSCLYAAAYWQGRLSEAGDAARRGSIVAREVGNQHNVAVFEGHRSMMAWSLRDYGEAIAAARASYEIHESIGEKLGIAVAAYGLGHLYREVGRLSEARVALESSLEGYRSLSQRLSEAGVLSTLADLHLLHDRPEEARTCIDEGLAVAREIESDTAMANLEGSRGRLLHVEGRFEEAEACFRNALTTFAEQGLVSHVPAIRSWLAEALAGQGRGEQAMAEARLAWAELLADEGPEDAEQALWNLVSIVDRFGPTEEASEWAGVAYTRVIGYASSLEEGEARRTYLDGVPPVRSLINVWRATQPVRLTVEIARAKEGGAGDERAGGPETVRVEWTVEAAEDEEIDSPVARRRHRLVRLRAEAEAQGAAPSAADLARALGVSRRTIERDIAAEGNIREADV